MTTLLLHGFTGSGASWRDLIALSGLDASQFLTPDLPGHGANVPADPAAYTMEATAAALINGLDTSDTPHLYGYSMGGRLALYLALTYPERFASLTLESASPGLKTDEARAARRAADEALAHRIEQNGIEAFVAEWEKLSLWDSQTQTLTPDQQLALHEARLRNDPHGLAHSLRGLGTGAQPSLWERMWEIKIPCLLITGEYDHKFSAISHEMQMEQPRVERVVIANAGHAVHLEQPASVLKAWAQFMKMIQALPTDFDLF
jgi:2-succinyl-6-hydroxy-2,4-cyclohexadiene-1-carboxylate synthase